MLDLGCGDGSLLALLNHTRATRGYGVEINDANIVTCVKNGINVIQNNLEGGLSTFESDSFDYVIPVANAAGGASDEKSSTEMLRVGRQVVVTFPNFGYWRNRWQIIAGRMPVSKTLPYQVVRHAERAPVPSTISSFCHKRQWHPDSRTRISPAAARSSCFPS